MLLIPCSLSPAPQLWSLILISSKAAQLCCPSKSCCQHCKAILRFVLPVNPYKLSFNFPGRAPLLSCQYWVPRVCLLFLAEDPQVFAQRVVDAHSFRKKTEALLRYNLYVDCMPIDGLNSISEEWLERMKLLALQTPRLEKEER